jgi:hypothetical protein
LIDPIIDTERSTSQVSDGQARKTALIVATVLLLIAGWNIYRERMPVAAIFGGAALALGLTAVLLRGATRRFHVFWMRVASALGYINSRVLLCALYYAMFVPYGFVSRLFRDPLRRRGERQQSYWIDRKTTRQTREGFERLF